MPSLASLASALRSTVTDSTSSVAIVELDDKDVAKSTVLRFQYFPESIADNKRSVWRAIEVPGGSLPLYQWVSSGERTISFTATFTTDIDFSVEARGSTMAHATRAGLMTLGHMRRNVDIRAAILWLRRFMMPRYAQASQAINGFLTLPPRKLQLHIPGSGIGLAHGGMSTLHDGPDYITAIMQSCDVTWDQYFPSGLPRIATVQLAFAQIAQFEGVVSFPSVTDKLDTTVYGDSGGIKPTTNIFPYTLKGKAPPKGK